MAADRSEKSGVEPDNLRAGTEAAEESDDSDSISSSEEERRSGGVWSSSSEELPQEPDENDCYNVNSTYARAPLSEPLFTSLTFRGNVDQCFLHPKDENMVVVWAGDTIYLFNIKENCIYREKKFEDMISDVQLSFDGEFIYVKVKHRNHYVLHTDTLQMLRKTYRDDIYICLWHPLKQLLFMATQAMGMLIASFPDVKIRIIEYDFERLDKFTFFPSGDRIFAAFRFGKFCVWNVESLETIATFIDKEYEEAYAIIGNVEMNNSGTMVAYRSSKLKVMSPFDGSFLAHIPYGGVNYEMCNVITAFSSDDNYLAVGNIHGEVYIIATCSFELQSKFKNKYEARIFALQWSNRTLFVGFADGYVRSIDIITGDLIKEFHCHPGLMINFQLFKHENKFLAGLPNNIKIFAY